MTWFLNLTISKKLVLSFLCVLALTAVVGVFSIGRLSKVNQASSDVATNWLPSIRTLADTKLTLARIRSIEAQMGLFIEDEATVARFEPRGNAELAILNADLRAYEEQISEADEKALYPDFQKNVAIVLAEHIKLMAAVKARDAAAFKLVFMGDSNKSYTEAMTTLDKLADVNVKGTNKSTNEANATYLNAQLWIWAMLAAAILVGMLSAFCVARMIATPLAIAVGVAKRVAAGDLTADIRPMSKDETGQLMLSLKEMNDSLLRIVGQVRAGTDTIATASGQIASGNLDLSSRTEQQASSLEETASAMEELTSTVKQNADNARQASQLAIGASQVAVEGGNVVGKVIDTMSSINESSKKIVDIISVIDGIAFQTNILALNAAVEAARAGEQGRGFAVVASEVRSLAQRSAAAAKEIKTLIDDSVTQVDAGAKLVEDAGKTMTEVVNSVRRVTDIVSEISSASQEQNVGIEEINRAVVQMDEVTQQNAALVEEAAAAAQSLQDQAEKLADIVSVFKLTESAYVAAPRAAASVLTTRTADRTAPRGPALRLAPSIRTTERSAPAAAIAAGGGDWETF
jgi:methyl-accepting chemotaxis protein